MSFFARDLKGNFYIYSGKEPDNEGKDYLAGPVYGYDTDRQGYPLFENSNQGKWNRIEKPGCIITIKYPFSRKIGVIEPQTPKKQ